MDPTTNPQQMMEIEIKFAKGKVDYVIVHYGDDPITLAKEFVTKHNLKPSSVQIIAQYIESTVLDFIQAHQNEEKSNIESDGTNRQSEEKYEDSRRPSEDQRPPRKDKIERNRSESEAPSAIMSKDDYKSPPSVVSNSRSVDNHSSYLKENSMPDRVPPTTPGMRKGEREQHDHAYSSKANSIRSIADDVSNDTTVPNNNLNRDALEQSQYGNVSERSSFYNHTQTQSQTPQRYGNNNNITRSSPSLSQSLLDSSQALKKSNQQNSYNRDEDDNNTIDKIVEKNLFISEPTRSTDDAAKRPESKRKPTVTEYDESMSGKPRKEKIAEGANPRYSTNQQNNSRPTSISKASRDEEYFSNQPSTRNIRGQSVTASDYIAQEEERKFFANAADDEDDEEDASPEYAENPNDVHKYDSRVDVDEDQAPLEDGEGNIVSYDDYTFRSDLDSLTKTDQNTLTTNPSAFNYDVAEHEDEDPEAKYNRLKYGTLKRAQTAVTVQTARTAQTSQSTKSVIKTTLKPATKSLQMGKQKLLSPQSQSQKLSNSKAEKEKLVGKTVNERLYYNAELMKKKKDLIIMKNEEKKMAELENEKFRLNEGSQKIIETIQSRNYGDNNSQCTNASDIGQKLYLDGINALENKKKKLEKVNKLKENFIDSWSCVKCGTFHKVSASQTITNTPQMWGANSYDKYRCSNCCFNNQDSIESFKPTNVGLLLNENMKENVEKNRKQHMISTTNNTTNIHEHLYQQGKQHEQMLALNRALWEDLNEKMSFKPNISEKSKAIIKSYQQQPGSAQNSVLLGADSFDNDVTKGSTLENEDNDEITSMQQKINNTKITGQNMKEYFSKPTFDRLISTNTRSFVDETIAFHNRNQLPPNLSAGRSTFANSRLSGSEASTVNTQVSNLPNKAKQDQFVNRLVNEYKEKGQRMDERTNKYYTYDVNTGQKLWKPKIPAVPEEYGVKILSSSSNDSKRDIWNDILRRDKELLEEKLKKQKDTIEKTLQEIQKNQVKALPSSNEILQNSTQKNLEDLYKLLLVNTHPLNDTIVSTDDESDEQERDGEERSQSIKQPPPNATEEEFAFGNPDGRGQKLRMDMLKPTNNNVNNNQDEAASNYSFLQDNNTIVSEKQLNEVITNYLSNWKEKKLDLLLIKPNLLINEISTLLLDMKYHVFNRWQSKQRLKLLQEKNDAAKGAAPIGAGSSKSAKSTTARSKIDEGEEYRDDGNDDLENIRLPGEGGEDEDGNDKDNNQLLMTHPQELLISYEEFVKLAGKCIKKRSGPGKGYIFAPKKKADIAIQMKLEEYSEETFHPEIGKNSEAIIQKQRQQLLQQNQLQNNNFNEKVPILPIEDILTEDGKRIQKKIEILRQEKFAQEEAQLTFKPFLYKPPSYVVPRYRGLDISELEDQENHQNNGIDEGELASNFSGRGPDDENFSGLSNIMGVSSTYHHPESLRTSHLSNATTAKAFHSSNNTVGSNTIFDIPNVTIGNKQATGAISGGGGAIRGGGGGAGKNVTGGNTSVANSIPNGSNVTQAASSKDTRSVASNITNSDALSSPSTKGPIQANELMTPPHVRQTRLLNQTNFPPPPGPAPAPAASTAGNNNQNNNNSNNMQKMGASEDTQDSKNTHSLNNKDDSSIFTLTESAASIPGKTFEDSRTMSEKKKQLDRLNAKNNQQQQQHHQQQPPSSQQNSSYSASYSQQNSEKRLISKKSAQHVLRLDSSSLESYSPPMSLSSASQVEEGGRYSQMSAEFPSKFSAVSDVSHQAFQSSSEIDDHHQQQQRRPPPNKSGAVGGGGYSKAPLSATSINVRKPTVHPNAPLPPPLPATGGGAGVSSSNQSIESGYSGNLSSVNSSAPEGYSKQLVASHHPAAKGSAGATNKPSGYLKASGVGKSLPLLPHEVHRHAPGKGSSAAGGGQQKKPEGRYSLDTDSYYSDENSTISTESSTIVRSRKI